MWTLLAAALGLSTVIVCTAVAASARRRPVGVLVPMGIALTVGVEAVIACALSPLHLFARWPVAIAHVVFIGAVGALVGRSANVRSVVVSIRRAPRLLRRPHVLAVTLAVGVAAVALFLVARAYVPSNWDSMTYRLARIAHWIQHRSVAPYPTAVDRQVSYPPGAEYVLASWMVIAGNDHLANFLQLVSWLAVSIAVAPLLRTAGAPRRVAAAGVVVTAFVPMAVLQATSTQNDLVAAAVAMAAVAAAVPFLHRRVRFRARDGALLGAILAAAALTKPSAAIAVVPIIAAAGIMAARAARHARASARLARTAVLAVGAASLLAGPDAAVRLTDPVVRASNVRHAATYVYPPFGEAQDRALNLLRGLVRHFPTAAPIREALHMHVPPGCPDTLAPCAGAESRDHEDYAGNPLHVALVLVLSIVAAFRWRALPRRSRGALVLVAASWVAFQVTFRHNQWVARLETPTYCLAAFALVAFARPGKGARGFVDVAAGTVALLVWAAGARVAFANETRPALPALAWPEERLGSYYANRPGRGYLDELTLRVVRSRGCDRLGLFVGEDSYDYSLTWPAMQAGIETRHVAPGDPWPCAVFTDGTVAVPAEAPWRSRGVPFLLENLAVRRDGSRAAAAPPPAPL